MTYERRIKVNDRNYYLGVELKYNDNKFLSKVDGSYFDTGDFGIMIETIEEEYKKNHKECIYDKDVGFMNDVIYLYDRFPFISYIRYITYDNEGHIVTVDDVSKDEIVEYINKHNIVTNKWDKKNCRCPLLYQ